MPEQTFTLNDKSVTVDVEDDAQMLEAIRDMLGLGAPTGQNDVRDLTGDCGSVCGSCPAFTSGTCHPEVEVDADGQVTARPIG